MLHMAVLRSPHAHAVIRQIDLSRAQERAPGVRLALSGADLAGKIGSIVPNWIIPGTKVPDRPVVAIDRVRFVGECVALVVAEQPGHGPRCDRADRRRLRNASGRDRRGSRDPRRRPATARQRAATISPPSTRWAAATTARPRREADQVITLRIANNRLIPTCMETRSILAEPDVDEHPDALFAEPGASHAPPLDRRHCRHFRTSAAGSSRPTSAAALARKCTFIRRSCSARIWRACLACP